LAEAVRVKARNKIKNIPIIKVLSGFIPYIIGLR